MIFLNINNLNVSIEGKKILNDFNITINEGEVHAIMGPNGCGKSTLANVLAGNEDYEVNSGKVIFKDDDLLDLNIEERAQKGLFLAFQYPVEIPGVNITPFLKSAIIARLKAEGKKDIDPIEFAKELKNNAQELGIKNDMLTRSVNEGFSGGEKKRFEILQMSILKPKLSILDETDSGLDVDGLRIVGEGISNLRTTDRGYLVVTHYQRLLEYVKPDYVHVFVDGNIVETGGTELSDKLEKEGYESYQ